jgi:putative FmdB family regulatory protein
MTTYQYECERCGAFDKRFVMGKAPEKVKCSCKRDAARHYGTMNFILKGGGWPSKEIKENKPVDLDDTSSYIHNPKA